MNDQYILETIKYILLSVFITYHTVYKLPDAKKTVVKKQIEMMSAGVVASLCTSTLFNLILTYLSCPH